MARLSQTAVLALHFQNDVLHADGKIRVGLATDDPARARVIDAATNLLSQARGLDWPVVHVRIAFCSDYHDLIPNCAIFRKVREIDAVVEGTWGAKFFDDLGPASHRQSEYVITHKRTSAFIGTDLDALLRHLRISQLFVAGVATHSVVEMTVRHASDLGFDVTVLADACACADPLLHDASLRSMSLVADVSTVARAFEPENP